MSLLYAMHGTLFTIGLVCDVCLGIKGLDSLVPK